MRSDGIDEERSRRLPGNWRTALRQASPSILMVGVSKASGVARDLLIVSLVGFTATGDAVIFAMGLVSFVQATAYRAGINRLGVASGVLRLLVSRLRIAVVIAVVSASQALLLVGVARPAGLLGMTLLFLPLTPLAALIGIAAATGVAQGDRTALVKVACLQNCVLIIGLPVAVLALSDHYLPVVWLASVAAGLLGSSYLSGDSSVPLDGAREIPTYDVAVLSPAFFFAAILAERYFYSLAAGSLVLVRLLETSVASIIFLLDIAVLNKRIAGVRDLVERGDTSSRAEAMLRGGLRRSILAGSGLYILVAAGLLGLIQFRVPPLHDLPVEVLDVVAVLAALYGLHFLLSTACDYQERSLFLRGVGRSVLLMNATAFGLTLSLNPLFATFVPCSVVVISILLKAGRLWWGGIVKSHSHGP